MQIDQCLGNKQFSMFIFRIKTVIVFNSLDTYVCPSGDYRTLYPQDNGSFSGFTDLSSVSNVTLRCWFPVTYLLDPQLNRSLFSLVVCTCSLSIPWLILARVQGKLREDRVQLIFVYLSSVSVLRIEKEWEEISERTSRL